MNTAPIESRASEGRRWADGVELETASTPGVGTPRECANANPRFSRRRDQLRGDSIGELVEHAWRQVEGADALPRSSTLGCTFRRPQGSSSTRSLELLAKWTRTSPCSSRNAARLARLRESTTGLAPRRLVPVWRAARQRSSIPWRLAIDRGKQRARWIRWPILTSPRLRTHRRGIPIAHVPAHISPTWLATRSSPAPSLFAHPHHAPVALTS